MASDYFCPLLNKKIEDGICFDIHCVVEEMAPKWTAPKEIYDVDNYKDICQNCPNHRDD